jgi:hypothetical protein
VKRLMMVVVPGMRSLSMKYPAFGVAILFS